MQEFHGLGLKTSSLLLRMCGADYLVPVDSWMLEMLYFHGYPCEVPTRLVERERWETKDRSYLKRRKKSLTREQYLQAERCAIDLANKYGVSGYLLQMAIWSKFSSFRKRQNLAKAALH
jgi:thermostable 8-oxoguanine DNA glycosylase